ncbi:Predicted O-linked N-acetylglucosamine transferase, SPINDLY family, partial [Polaromonas sp. YR568]
MDEALSCYASAIQVMPELARAHFNRGNILLDRGDAKSALDAYLTAVKYKPDSATAYYNIGGAHLRLEDPGAAAAAYRQAIVLRPDFVDAQEGLQTALEMAADYAETSFQQGLAQHDLEHFEQAKALYRQVIKIKPDHVEACNNLASLLMKDEAFDEAAAYFRRAVETDPANTDTQLNLGKALKAAGLLTEAAAHYRHLIDIMHEPLAALLLLADLEGDLGDDAGAIATYRRALEIDPRNTQAILNQGHAYLNLKQHELAETCFRLLLEIEPTFAEGHSNLGVILKKRKNLDAAAACFRQALAIRPDFAAAHLNLGNVQQAQGQIDDAIASYRRALEIKPDFAAAHSNYGTALQFLDKLDLAEQSYRRALEIDADMAEAHNNLGIVLSFVRRSEESIACYQRAIAAKPDYAEAHANLSGVLKDVGRLDEALVSARRSLKLDPDCVIAHNNLLFIHNYVADQPAELLLADAQRFGNMAARLAQPYTDWPNSPDRERCLRVGFVSGDLCDHPVGYFLDGVLAALSSQASRRLELFGYPNRSYDDATSQRLKANCTGWHPTTWLSDEAVAQRIRDDGIDILIDLSGHTAHNRLSVFAWKPAPVQVSWLGYFATTGVAAIDYFVADPWTLLPDQEAHFSEQIWRLPETRLCFTPPAADIAVNELPALTNGYVTFGCFNNLSKMNDAVVALWARVLHAVPGSRLFLKYQQLAEASVRQRTCDRFAIHGIEPGRLIFEDYGPRADYLAAYRHVDIALDPFPFPGGTTTVEALWMGIPVLTLAGQRFLSRQGVGLLINAGLPEWVAADANDYVARAVSHCADLQRLASLRNGLRQQVLDSPIFDAPRFAHHFETALRSMWHIW